MAEAPKTISTRAEFDALEVGTAFFEEGNPKPNGEPWVKTAPKPDGPGRIQSVLDAPQRFLQETLPGAADRAFNMALGGAGDKLRAAWQVPMGYGGFSENLARINEDESAFREEHGTAALAGDVIGGLGAMPAAQAVGQGIARAAPWAAKAVSRVPRYLQNVGLGTGAGAVYGAGDAPPGQEVSGAKTGAAIGAGISVALPAAVAVVGPMVRGVAGRVRPKEEAVRRIAEGVREDGLTPNRLAQRLANLQRRGGGAVVADAGGEGTRAVARESAEFVGAARRRAELVLEGRAGAESSRMAQSLRTNLNSDDWFQEEERLLKTLRDVGEDAYKGAYAALRDIVDPAIIDELRTAGGVSAFRSALTDFANARGLPQGEVAKMLRTFKKSGSVDLEVLDNVKQSLDAAIRKAYGPTGGGGGAAKGLEDIRDRLVAAIDEFDVDGLYKAARLQYGGAAETAEALAAGRRFHLMEPEQVAATLKEFGSDASRRAFRAGAVQNIFQQMGKVADGASPVRRIFGTAAARRRIRALMPDDESFRQLRGSILNEQVFRNTQREVLQGGATLPHGQGGFLQTMGNIGAILGSALPGGGHALVKAGIGRRVAMQIAQGAPDAEVARLLLNQDQVANARLLKALQGMPSDEMVRRLTRIASLALSQQSAARKEDYDG
jgi:hypothetical protein